MNLRQELSKQYWPAFQVTMVFQVLFVLLAAMILDGGQCFQWSVASVMAFWGGVAVIVIRRPTAPTKTDLFYIRWSYPLIALVITPFLFVFVWKLKGINF